MTRSKTHPPHERAKLVGWIFLLLFLKEVTGCLHIHRPALYLEGGDTPGYFAPVESWLNEGVWRGTDYPEGRIWEYPFFYMVFRLLLGDHPDIVQTGMVLTQIVFLGLGIYAWGRIWQKGFPHIPQWVVYSGTALLIWLPFRASYEFYLLSEGLLIPVELLGTAMFMRAWFQNSSAPSLRWLFAGGLLLAYAYWIRPVALTGMIAGLILLVLKLWNFPGVLFRSIGVFLLPFLVATGTWMTHVYRKTGVLTPFQSIPGPVMLAYQEDLSACLQERSAPEACPTLYWIQRILVMGGVPHVPWDPPGLPTAYFWYPRPLACSRVGHVGGCWNPQDSPIELPEVLYVPPLFPRDTVHQMRNIWIQSRFFPPPDISDSTRLQWIHRVDSQFRAWYGVLRKTRPYLQWWGPARLAFRHYAPDYPLSGKSENFLTSLYLEFTRIQAWLLTCALLLASGLWGFMTLRGKFQKIWLLLGISVLFWWGPTLAYILYGLPEARYMHPQFPWVAVALVHLIIWFQQNQKISGDARS